MEEKKPRWRRIIWTWKKSESSIRKSGEKEEKNKTSDDNKYRIIPTEK